MVFLIFRKRGKNAFFFFLFFIFWQSAESGEFSRGKGSNELQQSALRSAPVRDDDDGGNGDDNCRIKTIDQTHM